MGFIKIPVTKDFLLMTFVCLEIRLIVVNQLTLIYNSVSVDVRIKALFIADYISCPKFVTGVLIYILKAYKHVLFMRTSEFCSKMNINVKRKEEDFFSPLNYLSSVIY